MSFCAVFVSIFWHFSALFMLFLTQFSGFCLLFGQFRLPRRQRKRRCPALRRETRDLCERHHQLRRPPLLLPVHFRNAPQRARPQPRAHRVRARSRHHLARDKRPFCASRQGPRLCAHYGRAMGTGQERRVHYLITSDCMACADCANNRSALPANAMILEFFRRNEPGRLAKGVAGGPTIIGNVFIHPSAKVHPTAKVRK